MGTTNEVVGRPYLDAFRAGLRERGYLLGSNLTLDERYAEGNAGRFPALAEELIALKPDVLVGIEGPAIALSSKTTTIPIVFIGGSTVLESGLVQSLARPGANVTGVSFRSAELIGKQFELLLEISPKIARVALFTFPIPTSDPGYSGTAHLEQNARKAASDKGLTLVIVSAKDVAGARKAFEQIQSERIQGLVVAGSGTTLYLMDEIVAGARRLRLPSISGLSAAFAETGGLATYGTNFVEGFRYAAKYVDRILKGAKPAEMPVEQMMKFEFVVNLKTAREIGIKLPASILLRADRVIE